MPQHFQLLDEYFERQIEKRAAASRPHAWGLRYFELDEEALARGLISLRRLEAILPDGSWIDIGPERALAPATIVPPAPHADSAEISIYVAVPDDAGRGTQTYAGDPGMLGARWLKRSETRRDAFGRADACDVEGLEPNVQLFAGKAPAAGYVSLKIAEVVTGEDGVLSLRDHYVPPSVRIGASRPLMSRLARLAATAAGRQASIGARYRSRTTALVEYGAKDITLFWYLFALNGCVPVLSHWARTPDTHPEQLYLGLAQLTAQLSSFLPQRVPAPARPYDHLEPARSIFALMEELEGLLSIVFADAYRSLPLQQSQRAVFVSRTLDEAVLRRSRLYLIAGGEVSMDVLRDRLPKATVISSEERITETVRSNLPGLELRLDLQPSTSLPVKADHVYLELQKQGPHWDAIRESKTIAIFQPTDWERVHIELIAVEDA